MGTAVIGVDTGVIPVGANEELAGPPHAATAPVRAEERISSIDTLRGFALMGILIMNICSFGLSVGQYEYPLSTVHPVFSGPHWKVNTALWFFRWIFAEGKMRGLFSMLFGAGVVLLTERAEKRGAGVRVADIFTRRNMWLVIFGMVHAYFIWEGDILFLLWRGGAAVHVPVPQCAATAVDLDGGDRAVSELAGTGFRADDECVLGEEEGDGGVDGVCEEPCGDGRSAQGD